MRLFNMAVPPVRDLVAASGGMVLSKTAPAFLQRFIPLPMTGIAGLATRAAVSLLAGSLASRFAGRRTGEMVTFGGMLAVADDALSMFVYPQLFGMAPTTGAYIDTAPMGAYLPAGVGAGNTVGQYLSPGASVPTMGSSIATASRLDASERL